MSLGQFILLENAIKSSEPEYNISSLIIRPIDEDRFDNEDFNKEEEILLNIIDEDFLDVYSVIQTMLLNRDYILFTKFSGVIYDKTEPKEEEEEDEYEEDQEVSHNSQWFWYKVVRALSNEDITFKMDSSDLLRLIKELREEIGLLKKEAVELYIYKEKFFKLKELI